MTYLIVEAHNLHQPHRLPYTTLDVVLCKRCGRSQVYMYHTPHTINDDLIHINSFDVCYLCDK